ncbi:MAG: hypothetical protein QOI80_3148 [Solirubrobacteraceae bacterium]|nr:hypothetical protein [Solirubrobacteraceae bacterium]
MLPAGAAIGGYRIDGVLGQGGMGVVYEARQLSLQRAVALKVLAADVAAGPARDRFRREAELQAGLDHAHVVTVFEAGEAAEGLFIAMQLIRGGTLRDVIDAGLDPAEVVRLLAPIADALDVAHAAGLVHRDVKPRNILLDDDRQRAFLADFGLVKALDGLTLTDTGGFMGTPDYVAPEQVRGEPAAPASDVYSLAAVLYHCLTGSVVFPVDNVHAALHAHTHEPPTPASARRPELPPALDAPLARGLAKDPADRPPTASALLADLAAALRGERTVTIGAARRTVTVVCAGFPAPEDPELRHAALGPARARCAAVADRHGGSVRPGGGEPVAIVFGLVQAREDDAARAVRAGEELGAAGASVGIDTGLVFVDGADVTGTPLQSAAALQLAAADGEVRLGEGTQRLVGPPARHSPFVGRAAELAALRAAVRDDEIRLVTVIGPAGIGKSRLIQELGGPVVTGRCLPYGEALTYRPFAEMLGELPAGRPEEVALAVRRGLEARAPVVAVVEDVHLADPALLDVIDYVVAFSSGFPVTLVCATRPELFDLRPAWAAPQPGRRLISLDPLPEADAIRMAGPGAEALVATAEGNPFFLEQLLAVGDTETVPPSIQAVLSARIDRLEAPERDALERAAVIGRSFLTAALGAVTTGALLGLVRRDLIHAERGDAFRFAHALIRDVAYESIPRQRRADLHEAAARWFDDDAVVGHHLEQAHRYRPDAGLAGVAARRLELAAGGARSQGDLAAAVGLLERAVALRDRDARLLPDLAATLFDAGRIDVAASIAAEAVQAAMGTPELELRARVEQHLIGLHTGAAESIEPARRAAVRATQELSGSAAARAWQLLAVTHWIEGQAADADAAWQRAAALADARERIEILGWSASAAAFGPLPVETAIRRCAAIAEAVAASPMAVAFVARPRALLHALRGDVAQARALIAESNAALDALGGLQASISHHEAMVELLAGAPERAEARLRADRERLSEIGEHSLLATTIALLAQAVAAQGRWDEAAALCEACREAADPADHGTQALWRTVQARHLARLGRLPDAEALAREAVGLVARTDALTDRGEAFEALAEVLRAGGRTAEAESAIDKAVALYDRKGATVMAARARGGRP